MKLFTAIFDAALVAQPDIVIDLVLEKVSLSSYALGRLQPLVLSGIEEWPELQMALRGNLRDCGLENLSRLMGRRDVALRLMGVLVGLGRAEVYHLGTACPDAASPEIHRAADLGFLCLRDVAL